MVAANLSAHAAPAVLLHEAFHSGGQRLIGSAAWNDLIRRLSALYWQAERSTGKAREVFDAARSRAAGAAPRLQVEEFGAYAVEEYATLPAAFRRWVDDVLGALKAWVLRRFGRQFGQVTPAQLRALAKEALTSMALQGRSGGQQGGIEPGDRYSLSAMKSVEANIRRGRDALARAVADKTSVHRAMFRNGLGWVDFVWRSTGRVKPSGKTVGAMGLSHIFEARQRKDGMTEADVDRLLVV
ncbi:hypothetical protein [Azotobacter salinestris]|uniref:hypothetical protein n=1 Tax=Azotobacter salinestris TaxID=69964 RepID=UPI00126689B8|nr:hypothetical protein [Azotobacter salinestris]